MPKIPLDFAFGSYESQSAPLSAQRCINWIPTIPQIKSLSQRVLFGRPGIKEFATLTGVNRGSILANKVPYFVNGMSLFSLDANGVKTRHGTVSGDKRVSMATNTTINGTTKIAIVVPGGDSYAFDSSLGTVVKITDPDFQTADSVVFKDGFYVFSASDGLQFFNSLLNDPQSYDALDFGTAEMDPDLIVALHVNHNELFVLGERTIEIFQNIGGSGFPFQRIPGANIQKGLHARASVVEFDNTFLFIGGGKNEDSAIWRVTGSSSASKISTSAVDHVIQKYTKEEISNAFAMTYAKDGNFFAVFTLESNVIGSKTFVYNATTSALSGESVWSEFQTGMTDNRWRVQSIVSAYGKTLVGDQSTNKIGYLDNETFTDYGDPILYQKTTSPFSEMGEPLYFGDIELTLESGIGLTSGQGIDPTVRMEFSDDGGRTFSSEFSRNFGKIGAFGRRVVWRRQGRIPDYRVLRFTMTDPVRSNVLRLTLNVEVG